MPIVLICLDGMAPEYLQQTDTPVLDRLGREGRWVTGACQMPSVTNVNNVSILSGRPPAEHGINANFAIDRDGKEVYLESPDLVRVPLLMERIAASGRRVAAVASKHKLAAIIGRHAHTSFSVEEPAAWVVERIGAPPPIYSYDANLWLLRAARVILEAEQPDFLYVTSTDYLGHMLPPEHEEARANVSEIDRLIGELVDGIADVSIGVTADHGMNAKQRCISPEAVLAVEGISAISISTLQDRYTKHHGNRSGSAYVHLPNGEVERAWEVLAGCPGIERVLAREEAAAEFQLDPDLIGDLVLLGDRGTCFGAGDAAESAIDIRTHGSLHELAVPVISWGPAFEGFEGEENRSLGEWLHQRLDLGNATAGAPSLSTPHFGS